MNCSKNYICKFMRTKLWHHKLCHFHLPFWIWKVWKGREKITKIWVSREQKELFRWNKKYFLQFLKAYHLMKKQKFDKKIVDTSFKIYELSWLLHEDLKTATWYFYSYMIANTCYMACYFGSRQLNIEGKLIEVYPQNNVTTSQNGANWL